MGINVNFNEYNVNKALDLLGPEDFGPMALNRHMQIYTYVISNIAMVVLRIINVIFGNHQWCNNASASETVCCYIELAPNAPERNNQQIYNRIQNLYNALGTRRFGWENFSYQPVSIFPPNPAEANIYPPPYVRPVIENPVARNDPARAANRWPVRAAEPNPARRVDMPVARHLAGPIEEAVQPLDVTLLPLPRVAKVVLRDRNVIFLNRSIGNIDAREAARMLAFPEVEDAFDEVEVLTPEEIEERRAELIAAEIPEEEVDQMLRGLDAPRVRNQDSLLSEADIEALIVQEEVTYRTTTIQLNPVELSLEGIVNFVYDITYERLLDALRSENVNENIVNQNKITFIDPKYKQAICAYITGILEFDVVDMARIITLIQSKLVDHLRTQNIDSEILDRSTLKDGSLEEFKQARDADLIARNSRLAFIGYMTAFVLPRAYEEFTPSGERMGTGGYDAPWDPEYATISQDVVYEGYRMIIREPIQDPYVLFKVAIEKAIDELGVNGSHLSDEERKRVCRIAVYNMHAQAKLIGSEGSEDIPASCHPKVHYSPALSAEYQKPNFSFKQEAGQMKECTSFKTDLFSSKDVGCDPESVKRLLEEHKEQEVFIKINLNASPKDRYFANDEKGKEQKILCELIDTMADQVAIRYLDKAEELINLAPDAGLPGDINGPFSQYIQDLRTPYEVLRHSMLYAANALAKEGLIVTDAEMGISNDITSNTTVIGHIVTEAILELLQVTESQNDFSFKLNRHVEIPCGSFCIYEPSAAEPNILSAKERRLPHELANDNSDPVFPPGDPIKAAYLLKRLTSNEVGKVFLREYIPRDFEEANFRSHYIIRENGQDMVIGDDGAHIPLTDEIRDILRRKRLLERDFNQLASPETKAAITAFETEVSRMAALLVAGKFYSGIAQWLNEKMTPLFPTERVRPVAPPVLVRREVVAKQHQDVLLNYVEAGVRSQITIKDRAERTEALPERFRIRENETVILEGARKIRSNSEDLFERQFTVLEHRTTCGSCMYGAIALEIFGPNAQGQTDHYSWALRRTVANYMRANKEQFRGEIVGLPVNGRPVVGRYSHETIEAYNGRLDIAINAYAQEVEASLGGVWAGDIERRAISRVFGVEIALYEERAQFEVGTEGVEKGMLLPTRIIGDEYAGGPVRIYFVNGNHYKPVRFKDGVN